MCLYYNRVVGNTVLPALNAIVSKQSNGTKRTMEKKTIQLLDYLATHPVAKVKFNASSMILNIHSDGLYLSEPRARNRLAEYFFLGDVPKKGENIQMNGNIFVSRGIPQIVVCSAAGA